MRISTKARSEKLGAPAPRPECRILNKLEPKGWARISPPRYHAVEVLGESGVYQCPARGAGVWSEHQLTAWAVKIGAEVALTSWPGRDA
jgi:hypothetical protein